MSSAIVPVVVEEFEYEFEVVPHEWIVLSDGIRLSVKLWKPLARCEDEHFPVILEAIPYRKDDISLYDDSVRMEYFAGHGYICARLDLRGSGNSEGILVDEYTMREQCDLLEVVEWLSRLPESSGAVGMMGISWSGFNSLQVAQHSPVALKAIITVCASDDRYDNDVHYMGGSLLGFYQNWWGSIMHEFNIRPADPQIVGDEWYAMQMERMNANSFMTSFWLSHQNRDSYWKPGSVCEKYADITCPILAVGGWADGYTDAIVRLVDNCSSVTQGIIGPWEHIWPERGIPGPAIGFLQECLRWWDQWLKDLDTGVKEDPKIRYYLQEPSFPTPDCAYREGVWLETNSFTQGRSGLSWSLSVDGFLSDVAWQESVVSHKGPYVSHSSSLITGTQVDTWLPMGSPIDLPSEQSPDDERSLTFETQALSHDVEIVGSPVVGLRISSDKSEAFVFARLCSIWPDGTSELITRANLNLTHRDSHEFPEALEPGAWYDIEIPLKVIAARIPAGNRLRLALSTSYWPWIWPSREVATITIDTSASVFYAPIRNETDKPLVRPFAQPEIARGEQPKVIVPGKPFAKREYDPQTGVMSFSRSSDDSSLFETANGLTFGSTKSTTYIINENDPLSACTMSLRKSVFKRKNWQVETGVYSTMTCTYDDFVVETRTIVKKDGKEIHNDTHIATIPRCFN